MPIVVMEKLVGEQEREWVISPCCVFLPAVVRMNDTHDHKHLPSLSYSTHSWHQRKLSTVYQVCKQNDTDTWWFIGVNLIRTIQVPHAFQRCAALP